jgi:predicted ATP-grasp superfamily ATP-dependent carboligase
MYFEEYFRQFPEDSETCNKRANRTATDYYSVFVEEGDDIEARLYKQYCENPLFYTFCGFRVLAFNALYDVVSILMEARRCGWPLILGPVDCLPVLLPG